MKIKMGAKILMIFCGGHTHTFYITILKMLGGQFSFLFVCAISTQLACHCTTSLIVTEVQIFFIFILWAFICTAIFLTCPFRCNALRNHLFWIIQQSVRLQIIWNHFKSFPQTFLYKMKDWRSAFFYSKTETEFNFE